MTPGERQEAKVFPRIGGFSLPPFSDLEDTFRENFDLGLESAGASFAVYYGDKLVVNLYGGYADREASKEWDENTMTVFFSITKGLSSLALAMLIDRGHADYDDLITKYWPEFGKDGKEGTTIKHAAQHQAGLVYGDEEFCTEDVEDSDRMSAKFENMRPLWTPGTEVGYHTLTFGFLIDQIVRRIDPQKRGIVDFLKQEVIEKFDLKDISVGLNDTKDNSRVARIREPTEEEVETQRKRNPEAVRKFALFDNEHLKRVYENWPWVQIPHYNKPEIRRLPMTSNMGIGTARALAQLHSLIVQGKILSHEFLRRLAKPELEDCMDIMSGYPESKGFGWQYFQKQTGRWNFGNSGYGGQNVRVDMESGLAYAYLCNGLKAADADDVESFMRLQTKLYESLKYS